MAFLADTGAFDHVLNFRDEGDDDLSLVRSKHLIYKLRVAIKHCICSSRSPDELVLGDLGEIRFLSFVTGTGLRTEDLVHCFEGIINLGE